MLSTSHRNFIGLTLSLLLVFITPNALALNIGDSNAMVSEAGAANKTLRMLSSVELASLDDREILLQFDGVTCLFSSVEGCIVTETVNDGIRKGSILKTFALKRPLTSELDKSAAFRCSWCGIAVNVIEIVFFVATAATLTPVLLVVSVYMLGGLIILGYL